MRVGTAKRGTALQPRIVSRPPVDYAALQARQEQLNLILVSGCYACQGDNPIVPGQPETPCGPIICPLLMNPDGLAPGDLDKARQCGIPDLYAAVSSGKSDVDESLVREACPFLSDGTVQNDGGKE